MKVTTEVRDKMVNMRKKGATYKEIMIEMGVSKWMCITYLRDIEIDRSWIELEWQKAEREAEAKLREMHFIHILNLNDICPSAYWDYYCELTNPPYKTNERWLIDVTINQHKNLVDKALRRVEGYNHAILLKIEDEWKLMEIKVSEIV